MITNLELHETAKAMKVNADYCADIAKALDASKDVLKPFDGKVFNCKLEKALRSAEFSIGGSSASWSVGYYPYGIDPDKQYITVKLYADYSLPYISSWVRETEIYRIPLKFVGSTYRFDLKAYSQAVDERICGIKERIGETMEALNGKQFAKDLQRMAELAAEYSTLYSKMNFVVRERFERDIKPISATGVYIGLDFDKVDNTDYAEDLIKRQYSGADDGYGYSDGVREELVRIIKNDRELSSRDLSNPERDDYVVMHMLLCNEKPDVFWGTVAEAMQRIGDSMLEYDETADEYTCNGKEILYDLFVKSWGKHDAVGEFIKEMQEELA